MEGRRYSSRCRRRPRTDTARGLPNVSWIFVKLPVDLHLFEEALADHGTVILKFFLHLSKEEQKRRIDERLADPTKAWKFDESDLRERKLWPRYMRAYQEAIARTTTRSAPWFAVPSDARWYRDRVVGEIVVEALEALQLKYPKRKQ